GYSWTTYPERLEQAGVSWKIYQDEGVGLDAAGFWGWTEDAYIGNYGDNSLLYFDQYRTASPGNPLYDKARTGTRSRNGEDFFRNLQGGGGEGHPAQGPGDRGAGGFPRAPNRAAKLRRLVRRPGAGRAARRS